MASVFTYDPDPPRVSSPWLIGRDAMPVSGEIVDSRSRQQTPDRPGLLSEYGLSKLQAEPQDGPTEYKLHLLLRPRRQYTSMSTSSQSNRSLPNHFITDDVLNHEADVPLDPISSVPHHTRQERLQHLTTQLLWRLQQSSPYHASSSKELTIPILPGGSLSVDTPVHLQPLVPGLEESRGALYEIGVSDDGHLVGLSQDELDESLATLRLMAASLGCSVEVVRMVIVGDCEWIDPDESSSTVSSRPTRVSRRGKLWVAEALVTPDLGHARTMLDADTNVTAAQGDGVVEPDEGASLTSRGKSSTPQLRVTFTGPTTSGKSTLLGTLSTGTLDNGRGKSRLSLLKHRHEMVSGVTSSIAQELIGYREHEILNFSHQNIESWVDIHDQSEDGRLVFVSDSGGHPRYRRTVLRGLMNWSPHWSFLCLAADDSDQQSNKDGATSSAREVLGPAAAAVDLVKAHLTLSLQLSVPLVVVITKLDLASKTSLQKTMIKVLDAIKQTGRSPKILQPDQRQQDELQRIPAEDVAKIQTLAAQITSSEDLTAIVPIVLTSAVKGSGIGLIHALLENLPLPPAPTSRDLVGDVLNPEQPKSLFHIDDTFKRPVVYGKPSGVSMGRVCDEGLIVTGYLRFGKLTVGDTLVIGPFQSLDEEDTRAQSMGDRSSPVNYGLSISHPSSAELARIAARNAVAASATAGEWHQVQVMSIRNLRLPVHVLESGQAGSVGLVFSRKPSDAASSLTEGNAPRIRRGMVLAIPSKHMLDTGLSLQAASGFTATFSDRSIGSLLVGTLVNVYVASVRAAARVAGVTIARPKHAVLTEEVDLFDLDRDREFPDVDISPKTGTVEVYFDLLHSREWIELGSRLIVLEGGSQDRSGLEGFVGKVIEIAE